MCSYPGQQAGTCQTVFQVLGAPDHEHDRSHEQSTKEEQDRDGIENSGDLAEILCKAPGSLWAGSS